MRRVACVVTPLGVVLSPLVPIPESKTFVAMTDTVQR